jgi:hypothetical protein
VDPIAHLIRLCEQAPFDPTRIERFITDGSLSARDVTAAAYALAQKHQDEIAVFAYENRRAPLAEELIGTRFPALFRIFANHGLAESRITMNSDGGERFECILRLLLWMDNEDAALATVELLLAHGFDPDLPTEDGTLREEIEHAKKRR